MTAIAHIREGFAHHIIFSIGLLLILGFFLGKLSERFRLPAITGYIISGILVGDSGLQWIHVENSHMLHILSEVTLCFIAVVIGGEFSFAKLRIYGKKIILLTLAQMFTTASFVAIGLVLLHLPTYEALLLGAIAAATAPAATVVIVEKMKARGQFVDYLYGVVALDDAGTVVLFSIIFAVASATIAGNSIQLDHALLHAAKEIGLSLLIGVIVGSITHFATIKKRNKNEIKIIALGLLFLATSIAISLHVSPLITNMVIGMLLVNFSRKNIRILTILEPLTPPLYAIFFAIAGTELHFSIFSNRTILMAAIAFIVLRGLGKYSGIYAASALLKLPHSVRNYLGFALLPQAGVAIGLALFVQASPVVEHASPEIQVVIVNMINIVLISVFFNELLGPAFAKFAIGKAINRTTRS